MAEPRGVTLRHNDSPARYKHSQRARAKPKPSGPIHCVAVRRTAACATAVMCRHPRSRPIVTMDHWVELHGSGLEIDQEILI
jgi:hypothetical protein